MSLPVQKMYIDISKTYERVNHVLTFGLDILWRKKIVKLALKRNPQNILDVCTGTGEVANYLCKRGKGEVKVYAADFSMPMLAEAVKKPFGKEIKFTLADVKFLPYTDNSFDVITLSLGTRNINLSREKLIDSFREFHRILKPGGCYINLETSQPKSWLIRKLSHLYIALFVRPLGKLISGNSSSYNYLSKTIRSFYSADELAEILQEAGFSKVTYRKLFPGIAAIHQSVK